MEPVAVREFWDLIFFPSPFLTHAVDLVKLNFNTKALFVLNILIGLMMLGVSLDLKLDHFRQIWRRPKGPAIGLLAQFILLPAFTWGLTMVLQPAPSIALGMILIGSCPGGNLSNIMTYLARGNAAMSISMTACSTAAAVFMTPLNLWVWGWLNPHTRPILEWVSLDPIKIFVTILLILGLPLLLGIIISKLWPGLVNKIRTPFKVVSFLIFAAFVGGALAANWSIFIQVLGLVVFVVLIHNALALSLGYFSARAARLSAWDVRAVTIEVGIQNSALGLTLIFTFFGGLGGMAIIAGWWGIWHIIAGLTVAGVWSRRPAAGRPSEAAA
ncbi:MAG: bile acid:sodium symporter family protein [Proteobacteria bacterium]|nr:bile acid:sodium symporter family protein [Pseudomonadota bacterium]